MVASTGEDTSRDGVAVVIRSVRYYQSAWRRYRWLRFWTNLGVVVSLLFVVCVPRGDIAKIASLDPTSWALYFPALVWLALTLVLMWRTTYWRCPRCSKPFFRRPFWRDGWVRKCVHCGLPKWETPSERRVSGDALRH